jgi:hypothetical protein
MAENDKVPKFGRGQYESAPRNEVPPSVKHARSYFLDVVKTLAPTVLEDLGGEPYKLYWEARLCFEANKTSGKRDLVARHIWKTHQRPSWGEIEHPFRNPLLDDAATPVERDERVREFRDSLFNWSRRHRLDATWCRERAYDTLDWWCFSQGGREIQMWDYDGAYQTIMAFRGDHPRFTFEFKTLYPREGFRPDVKKRIMEAVEKELDAYLDRQEALAEENGMVAPRQKREKQHFEWLVCFQVNQMSYAEILELYSPEEFADAKKAGNLSDRTKRIRKAVHEVADFINLPLREDGIRPGRRPRSS